MSISFAFGSKRKRGFQWNMGLKSKCIVEYGVKNSLYLLISVQVGSQTLLHFSHVPCMVKEVGTAGHAEITKHMRRH